MKLIISEKNYKMAPRLHTILEQKVKKLDKYFPDDDTVCKVVMSQQGKHARMEVSINYLGTQIRSEVEGQTMYYNIDEIMPKLERQINKYRSKVYAKGKAPKVDGYEFVSDVDDTPLKIEKVKKFVIDKITPEEAIDSLELVDHDFYIFYNVKTENVEVVYRRKDGSIGLLQPQID